MQSRQKPAHYLPHVDGLRAVAILAVVAYHAAPGTARGGFVGVDVFFVISGFLITSIIAREIAEQRFSLPGFFARRVRRIVPALAGVYLATFLTALFLLAPEAMYEYGRSLIASAFFAANFFFRKTTDYFALPAHEKPLLHTWSLAIEEQFYILWPLALLVLTRWLPARAVIAVVLGLGTVSLGLSQIYAKDDPVYAFYMLDSRGWELLLGALLALTIQHMRLARALAETLSAAGLAAILASVFLLREGMPFPGIAAVPATLGTAAVILAGHGRDTTASRLLAAPPLVGIGLISYSLYLWHWPLLAFLRIASAKAPGSIETAAAVLASFVLAWLSWRFVERPFRTPGTRLYASPPRAILRGLLALSLFAGTGLAIREGDGWWWRLDAPARQVYAEMESENPYRRACDGLANIFANDEECTFGPAKPPSRSFDIAVFGDSNADQFVPLVAMQAARLGLSGRQVTQSACAPLFGAWQIERPQWREDLCRGYQSEMLRFLKANPDLKVAVLAANWASYQIPADIGDNGLVIPGDPAPPQRSREPQRLEHLLERTVRHILKRGPKVLLIGQIPYRQAFPLECAIAARRNGEKGPRCTVPAAPIREGLAVSNAAILAIAARSPDVSAVLPTDILCDREHCHAVMDGLFLYGNPGHLNAAGARYLSPFIALPVDGREETKAERGLGAPGR